MADTITTKEIARFIGEKASDGENIMREASHLLNTSGGQDLQEDVFSEMIDLQSKGVLPGLELLDSEHNPVTGPGDAFKVTEIKSATGETVYKMGDNNLRLKDRSDSLKELDGFSNQYKDQRKDPFQVANEQAREQKNTDQSNALRAAAERTGAQSDWIECMNEGGDVSPAVKVNDCMVKGLKAPDSLEIEQQGE